MKYWILLLMGGMILMVNISDGHCAVLESNQLKIEYRFIDNVEANFSLKFYFDSQPLINPKVMGTGFLGYDHGETLTPILEKSLSDGTPNVWKPEGPAVIIEIRFLPKPGWKDQKQDFRATAKYKESLKKVDRLRIESGGKLPDDCFELTFLADVHGLKIPYPRDTNYLGDYLALRFTVTREALQRFVDVLKHEYAVYRQKYNISE